MKAFQNYQNKLFLILSLSFLYFFVIYYVFGIYFQTNDDAWMLMVASGKGFVGTPSEYIMCMNILIGYALKGLYQVWPSVPWYTLFELFVLYVCFVSILSLFVSSKVEGSYVKWAMVLGFIAGFSMFLVNLQFTMVAMLLTISAYLVLVFSEKRSHCSVLFFTGFCFLLSALIRVNAFLIAQIVFLPLYIGQRFFREQKQKRDLRALFMFLAVFLLIGFATIYDNSCYRHHNSGVDWKATNALSCRVLNYSLVTKSSQPSIMNALQNAGWTMNDAQLLQKWSYFDSDVFSQKRLQAYLNALDYQPTFHMGCIIKFLPNFIMQDYYVLGILFLIVIIFLFWRVNRRDRFTMMVFALLTMLCFVYLSCFFKQAPQRVYWPLFYGGLILSMLFVLRSETKFFSKKIRYYLFPVLICLVCLHMFSLQQAYSFNKANGVKNYYQLLDHLYEMGDNMYIADSSFPIEYIDPLNSDPFHGVSFFSFGWANLSPVFFDRFKENHFNSVGDLLLKPNTIFVTGVYASSPYLIQLAVYFQEHFNTKARMLVVESRFQNYTFVNYVPSAD